MSTVQCCRCNKEAEAIAGATYGGPVGDELKQRVCNACWLEWLNGFGVKVINEMQLDMRKQEHVTMLMEQMRLFLNMPKQDG